MWGSGTWGEMVWGGVPVPVMPFGMLLLLGASFLAGGYFLAPGNARRRSYLLLFLLALAPLSSLAVSLPHGFTNGTVADANQVNANFEALAYATTQLETGLFQLGGGEPVPYVVDHERYVVEVGPEHVGVVVPLSTAIMDQLCRDLDGCEVMLGMLDWDTAAAPGEMAQRRAHLYLSETSNRWRLDNDVVGIDGAAGANDYAVFDCRLTDAETSLGANVRADSGPGFALLNALGGGYSDTTTRCRIAFRD